MVQVKQLVTAHLHEPGQHLAFIEPDMQDHSAAAIAVNVHKLIDGDI